MALYLSNKIFLAAWLMLSFLASASFCKASGDSTAYRKHIRYVLREHRKLDRHLQKMCAREYADTAIAGKYTAISRQYASRIKPFGYLDKKTCIDPLDKQYRQSETHKGIIEQTYKDLDRASKKFAGVLLATGHIKEATALQKQAFYSSGKYQYFKKFHAADLLSKLGGDKIAALKQSQQFAMPVMNKASQAASLDQFGKPTIPKVELPANLQTNAQANQAFAFDKTGTGPSKQQKFNEAVQRKPFDLNLDTTSRDTMLFRPNPYKLMPLQARLKVGGNFETGQLLGGSAQKKFSYTINLTYLLSPQVKPVLGLGYEHSFALDRNRVHTAPVGFALRAGAEFRLYKALSLFGNYENSGNRNRSGETVRKNDFVIGLTNDTGKKRMLKIWIGVKLNELGARNANPFVMRIGL